MFFTGYYCTTSTPEYEYWSIKTLYEYIKFFAQSICKIKRIQYHEVINYTIIRIPVHTELVPNTSTSALLVSILYNLVVRTLSTTLDVGGVSKIQNTLCTACRTMYSTGYLYSCTSTWCANYTHYTPLLELLFSLINSSRAK